MMFVYDIFWVFLSGLIFKQSVMVAVATGGGGESLPMLFLIPHAVGAPTSRMPPRRARLIEMAVVAPQCGYSLLGLGDVVIPGTTQAAPCALGDR